VDQDQPVPAPRVILAGRRSLAAPVRVAEQLPVELGQPTNVGTVEDLLLPGDADVS
jgi:hypothetical protein